MKIRKNQGGLAHFGLIFAVIAVLAVVGGAFYYVSKKNKTTENADSFATEKSITKDEFISKVESNLKSAAVDKLISTEVLTPKDDYTNIVVIDKDESPVTANTGGLLIKLSGNTPEVNGEISNYKSYINEIPQITKIDEEIANTASENGLKPDTINTRKDTLEKDLLDYKDAVVNYSAYKNTDFICVLGEPVAEYGGDGMEEGVAQYNLFFGCIDLDKYSEYHKLQKELREAYVSHPDINKFITKDIENDTVITVAKQKGNFIYGGTGSLTGGGAYALWQNKNGSWEYLFGGQDVPGCEETDNKDIPKELFADCYDESIKDIRPIEN